MQKKIMKLNFLYVFIYDVATYSGACVMWTPGIKQKCPDY